MGKKKKEMEERKEKKEIEDGKEKKKNKIQIRYSMRVAGKVTSITLKANVLALYLLMNSNPIKSHDFILKALNDFLPDWKGDNGKGLSDFMSQQMLESILGKKERKSYRRILSNIEGEN